MRTQEQKKTIILSTGGTGGHIMPAQALARDLRSRHYHVVVMTDIRGQKYHEGFEGCDLYVLPSAALTGGLFSKFAGLGRLGLGLAKAAALLKRIKPELVVGFGGYPSFPAVYVAQLLHIPTVIHEQNAVIGRANAFLANKAERIALSLPAVQGLDQTDQMRTVLTGNPVRADISELYSKPYPHFDDKSDFCVLVFGGSLGASILSDIVPATMARLSQDYRERLKIIQQCRAEDISRVRQIYAQAGIDAELGEFFNDIPAKMAQSHLIIARSGASTVAEVAVAGRPAIFVPLGIHKDQQQKMNADALSDAGGAWVMTEEAFNEETLLARVETFLQNPEALFKAAESARSCGKPDAARKLGNLVTAIASGWG